MRSLRTMSLPRYADRVLVRALRTIGLVRRAFPNDLVYEACGLFRGDRPVEPRSRFVGEVAASGADDRGPVNFVLNPVFKVKRPRFSLHRNVLFMPGGRAWKGAAIEESLSYQYASTSDFIERVRHAGRRRVLETGTLVQAENAPTYMDWCSEFVKSLAHMPNFPKPLVLPPQVARRSYVIEELKELGIPVVSSDEPVLIENACVLHRSAPINFWTREDVEAYRGLFRIRPKAPEPGSLLYLSRRNVSSEQEQVRRVYKSDAVAAAVEELGGMVVDTGGMTRRDFLALESQAETVIADHGAAMFNIVNWKVRNLVELVTDNWWSRCFVFLSAACGCENHVVVRCDPRTDDELRDEIVRLVRGFRQTAPRRKAPRSPASRAGAHLP